MQSFRVSTPRHSTAMFSPRWSSPVVLSVAVLVGCVSFYAGRRAATHELRERGRASNHADIGATARAEMGAPGAASGPASEGPDAERHLNELIAAAATPAREHDLAETLERLSAREPQRAIALASRVSNLRLRSTLLRVAIRGWGKTDPKAAVVWGNSQRLLDRGDAVSAALQGAVQQPEEATRVVVALMAAEPQRTLELGNDLVSALTETGQFTRAAEFARSGAGNCREEWLLGAFSRWAEYQPGAAADAALQTTDSTLREVAISSVITGWAPTDPEGLLAFSKSHFSPEQQKAAVSSAIGFWASSDPVAAANWIAQNDPGAVADSGVAAIALSPQLNPKPEAAANWASIIANPQLRSETLVTVVDRWAQADAPSAQAFAQHSPQLSTEERSLIVARLESRASP